MAALTPGPGDTSLNPTQTSRAPTKQVKLVGKQSKAVTRCPQDPRPHLLPLCFAVKPRSDLVTHLIVSHCLTGKLTLPFEMPFFGQREGSVKPCFL